MTDKKTQTKNAETRQENQDNSKGMNMNSLNFESFYQMPQQITEIMTQQVEKIQEASLEYFQKMEKIQREYVKEVTQVWGQALPGESKFWEAQTKMIDNGFDMFERMMASVQK